MKKLLDAIYGLAIILIFGTALLADGLADMPGRLRYHGRGHHGRRRSRERREPPGGFTPQAVTKETTSRKHL